MNRRIPLFVALAITSLCQAMPAKADLKLSQLIVELQPSSKARDVELWNDSNERAFVAVEPREILDPGTIGQADRRDPDPQKLGLLASPSRLVLEPGQRRLLRMASLNPAGERERVYRVTVRPVAGALKSNAGSGIKIMVGYDVLVLVRPAKPTAALTATRQGGRLLLHNAGNSSIELLDGKQCDPQRKACLPIGGKRLYAGASWMVDVAPGKSAEFTLRTSDSEERRVF